MADIQRAVLCSCQEDPSLLHFTASIAVSTYGLYPNTVIKTDKVLSVLLYCSILTTSMLGGFHVSSMYASYHACYLFYVVFVSQVLKDNIKHTEYIMSHTHSPPSLSPSPPLGPFLR